ncbi:MAG: polyphosphate kinase 2, partial [Sutterellaceae bacterium]|nr:polyphosphate kinase 2 [Sutterellaceae bacterium]
MAVKAGSESAAVKKAAARQAMKAVRSAAAVKSEKKRLMEEIRGTDEKGNPLGMDRDVTYSTPEGALEHDAEDRVASKYGNEANAIRSVLREESSEDRAKILQGLLTDELHDEGGQIIKPHGNPDLVLSPDWENGGYPYKNHLRRKVYETEKFKLQIELLKLQAWVKKTGSRIVILFEGRDAAGKGGTISRFMEHLNPRGARLVALEKPTAAEQGQWYFQR